MNNKECRLCQINDGSYSAVYDQPILKSNGYFSIASIGTFIPGWSLIVPEKHSYSMRNEYSSSKFCEFANNWINCVKNTFQDKIIVFEHGANHCGSQTSCGTNHAHIHVVPFSGNLLMKMQQDRDWVCTTYDKIKEIVCDNEYLLYASVSGRIEDAEFYIHILEREESQYFRRLLSEELGINDYSYKTSPRIEETIKSFSMLRGNAI